jgi:ubiquinone/menaquinone biosynthesis C-methylase UbiE
MPGSAPRLGTLPMKRDFDAAAKTWDLDDGRARLSLAVADAMIAELSLTGTETLLDYGTGTGIIALRLLPLVRRVIAADSSRGMLDVLRGKLETLETTNVEAVFLDLEQLDAPTASIQPDVVVSAMTLHHIADTARFAAALHRLLPSGGSIAIADLDSEDGDFHADNTGVEHFGFDRDALTQVFTSNGFDSVRLRTAYELTRPTASGVNKTFSVFLLVATKGV